MKYTRGYILMGPIQQSLNSIVTTAMDAVRTKEALESQKDREQREQATRAEAERQEDFNRRVKKQEEDYVSGKIGRTDIQPDVEKELFGSREQSLNERRVDEILRKQLEDFDRENPDIGNMSIKENKDFYEEQIKKAGDKLFLKGPNIFKTQQTYMLSRVFDKLQTNEKLSKMRNVEGADILRNMKDMLNGNQYSQQALLQLSDKIDTALNQMKSRKRWR